MPQTLIVLAILGLLLGGAAGYLIRAKKRGRKCAGCPYACSCASGSGSSGCDHSSADFS